MAVTINGTTGLATDSTSAVVEAVSLNHPSSSTAAITMDASNNVTLASNLTMTGGIYLGGSGSANLLQDYEEGTGSSVTISGSSSGSAAVAATMYYVKIGDIVNVSIQITNQTFPTFSGDLRCSLPFTCKSGTVARGGDCYWYPPSAWDTQTNFVGVIPQTVGTLAYAIFPDIKVDSDRQTNIGSSNSSLSGASGVYLNFSLTYQTA